MNRVPLLSAIFLLVALVALGCSGGGSITPVSPSDKPGLTGAAEQKQLEDQPRTYLWGFYDIYVDLDKQEFTPVPNRTSGFTMNVVEFLNSNPPTLGISFNGSTQGPGYVDVDLNVSLKHPISGKPKFNGYDVRGILIANGSSTMKYNTDLKYAKLGTDQYMLPDPKDGFGGPDGYTRWFNQPEFGTPGLFGYTQGVYASKNIQTTGTLNPYKYFADGLTATGNLWSFLTNTTKRGVFSSGSTNVRNYYIRFPTPTPGVKFAYAVTANWGGGAPQYHPSNTPESVACNVSVYEQPYYVNPTQNGGNIGLTVAIFGWDMQPTKIYVESTVLSGVYAFTAADMTPIFTATYYSTYKVKIPADNVKGLIGQEFWVICEYDGHDYTNDFGVPNAAGTDKLIAAFRYPLEISNQPPPNQPPVIEEGVTGNAAPIFNATEIYSVVATDPDNDPLTYAWTVTDKASSLVVFSGPGDGAGKFTVDFANNIPGGASPGQAFAIDCNVSDSVNPAVAAKTLDVICQKLPNSPPAILDGVSGNANPYINIPEEYTVSAFDPDSDPLTYSWLVTDFNAIFFKVEGVDQKSIILDFVALGCIDGTVLNITCDVTDNINPPVSATPLIVTCTIKPNSPPTILSGVDGNTDPGTTSVENYSVTAFDPDEDPLVYHWRLEDDSGVILTGSGPDLKVWVVDFGSITAADGDIFYIGCDVTDSINPPVPAKTLKVTTHYIPNQDPVCALAVVGNNPAYSWPTPVEMSFDASGSYDPDGDSLTFEWDFDSSGYVPGNAKESHVYKTDYEGPVKVRVRDGKGGEAICSVDVIALNNTLYFYSGKINDGGIVKYDDGYSMMTWTYCPAEQSWEEMDTCGPYGPGEYRLARTPIIKFPKTGFFKKIYLDIWHYSDMGTTNDVYGCLGVSNGTSYEPDWLYQRLVYEAGFNTNFPGYKVWTGPFGNTNSPEWTRFDCSDYADEDLAIALAFGEFGSGNPGTLDGWNVRAIKVWVDMGSSGNLPPVVISGVDGDDSAKPTDVKEYSVTAVDPDGDPMTYAWKVTNKASGSVVFSGPGNGAGKFTVDWKNNVGAADGEIYLIDCQISDGINPPSSATTKTVHITAGGSYVLYEYDGTINDGGIVDGTWGTNSWDYCPAMQAWDEYYCSNYPNDWYTVARSPYFTMPAAGTFKNIHIEVWHWGNMTNDGYSYGDIGYAESIGGQDYHRPNWYYEFLTFVEGFNFNDTTGYADFIGTYGSQASPEWSHFTANSLAGKTCAIALGFEEWGGTSNNAYKGFNVRRIKVWVEP